MNVHNINYKTIKRISSGNHIKCDNLRFRVAAVSHREGVGRGAAKV